jgi:hypothetical protein
LPAAGTASLQTPGSIEAIDVERAIALNSVFGADPSPARRAKAAHQCRSDLPKSFGKLDMEVPAFNTD